MKLSSNDLSFKGALILTQSLLFYTNCCAKIDLIRKQRKLSQNIWVGKFALNLEKNNFPL